MPYLSVAIPRKISSTTPEVGSLFFFFRRSLKVLEVPLSLPSHPGPSRRSSAHVHNALSLWPLARRDINTIADHSQLGRRVVQTLDCLNRGERLYIAYSCSAPPFFWSPRASGGKGDERLASRFTRATTLLRY